MSKRTKVKRNNELTITAISEKKSLKCLEGSPLYGFQTC